MTHEIGRTVGKTKRRGAFSKIPGLAMALLVFAAFVQAQESNLTLDKAVEIALSRHPEVLSAQQAVRSAAARKLQAEARPEPALTLSTEGIPFTLKTEEGQSTEINLGLEQTFEFPGKRALRAEIGRLGEDLAVLELERVRLALTARVKKAYYRAVLAERILAALEPSVGLLDRFIENIEIRYEGGKAVYGDILRGRIEKARLQNRIIEERRELDAARTDLLHLLGRSSRDTVRFLTDLAYLPFDKTALQVLDAARGTRPSLKMAAARSQQTEIEMKLATLSRKPDLSAGLFLPSKDVKSWGFVLSLSLPVSQKRWAGVRAEADAARETSLIAVDAVEKRLTAMIDTAYASVRAAEDQVKIFEQKLLAEIQDELKISIEYYQYGKMEAYALLDLFRSGTEAQIEHLRALYFYAVAMADLEVAGEDGE
jgi:outer membrane protein, heavy metal efflux system